MSLCKTILFTLAAASLVLPAAAAAQECCAQPADLGAYEPGDFVGYPEFQELGMRIRWQIDEAAREDRITPRAARDFADQLGKIQEDEARGFRFYGWHPPVDFRDDIRYALSHLSRQIDEDASY